LFGIPVSADDSYVSQHKLPHHNFVII